MAYCTFSSDDYRCDVRAASLVDRYEIIVAWRRPVGDVPRTEHLDVEGMEAEYEAACAEQSAFMRSARFELIDLPFAGETYTFDDFEGFAAKMHELQDYGYRIPEEVMAQLDIGTRIAP